MLEGIDWNWILMYANPTYLLIIGFVLYYIYKSGFAKEIKDNVDASSNNKELINNHMKIYIKYMKPYTMGWLIFIFHMFITTTIFFYIYSGVGDANFNLLTVLFFGIVVARQNILLKQTGETLQRTGILYKMNQEILRNQDLVKKHLKIKKSPNEKGREK